MQQSRCRLVGGNDLRLLLVPLLSPLDTLRVNQQIFKLEESKEKEEAEQNRSICLCRAKTIAFDKYPLDKFTKLARINAKQTFLKAQKQLVNNGKPHEKNNHGMESYIIYHIWKKFKSLSKRGNKRKAEENKRGASEKSHFCLYLGFLKFKWLGSVCSVCYVLRLGGKEKAMMEGRKKKVVYLWKLF